VKPRDALFAVVRRARLLRAAYRETAADFEFDPVDRWRFELADRKEFFRRALWYLAFNGIEGDYVEFGSHGAVTFRLAWAASRLTGRKRHQWAFDSFQGLPPVRDERDRHPMWVEGWMESTEEVFRSLCARGGLPADAYTTVPGFYSETLASNHSGRRPERIAMAYIDCDLYSSTREVLAFLEPYLRTGVLVAFDDYFCFGDGTVSGEKAALDEFLASRSSWRLVPYVQFGWHGMSFVVEASPGLTDEPLKQQLKMPIKD